MTSADLPITPPGLWRQTSIIVRRSLIHTRRMPEMLTDVTVQPVIFVLLFSFVFGAAVSVPDGGNYREFLLPGIMGQTIVFTAFVVAMGITADVDKGIVDRFRSLPISRFSYLLGRAIAALLHSAIGLTVMAVTGLVIGWRIHGGILDAILGFVLIVVFGFGMIWYGVLIGSWLRSVEAVNGFLFSTLFPLTFLSNVFVPTAPMADWLRFIAEWNPISSLVQAMRELWGNGPAAAPGAALPLQHPVIATVLWSLALTVVFAPVALRAFVRRTAD
ncbi:ABC transporter permease [Gordonia sp. VNK21]|uniref:ABC transporter permease n=1 Tax=Gordonia sp. VNK21 TaxID=3382483 RepID=UPI0038D4B697